MTYQLPVTDQELIGAVRSEYEAAERQGGTAFNEAKYRLAWSLVHSSKASDVELGLRMSEALRESGTAQQNAEQNSREAEYYIAVAYFKLKRYVDAWRQVKRVLQEWPDFRQATELKSLVEEKLIHEGLVGVGIAGAALVGGALAAGLVALMKR